MSKMVKQLDLTDLKPYKKSEKIGFVTQGTSSAGADVKTFDDFIRIANENVKIANENNRRLQDSYMAIHNDLNWHEWIYFSVSMKRWRIGPKPGTNNWVIEEMTGLDWKNQSHWTTQHTFWGGEKASTV